MPFDPVARRTVSILGNISKSTESRESPVGSSEPPPVYKYKPGLFDEGVLHPGGDWVWEEEWPYNDPGGNNFEPPDIATGTPSTGTIRGSGSVTNQPVSNNTTSLGQQRSNLITKIKGQTKAILDALKVDIFKNNFSRENLRSHLAALYKLVSDFQRLWDIMKLLKNFLSWSVFISSLINPAAWSILKQVLAQVVIEMLENLDDYILGDDGFIGELKKQLIEHTINLLIVLIELALLKMYLDDPINLQGTEEYNMYLKRYNELINEREDVIRRINEKTIMLKKEIEEDKKKRGNRFRL